MNFQEVWENSPVIDNESPHVLAARTCSENLKTAEDNCVYLLAIAIFLLILNIFSLVVYNRHCIIRFYRARFQPLPSSEAGSNIFPGGFEEDSIDMKG